MSSNLDCSDEETQNRTGLSLSSAAPAYEYDGSTLELEGLDANEFERRE